MTDPKSQIQDAQRRPKKIKNQKTKQTDLKNTWACHIQAT